MLCFSDSFFVANEVNTKDLWSTFLRLRSNGKEKRVIFFNFRQPPNTLHIHSSDQERTWPEAHCHVCDCRAFLTMDIEECAAWFRCDASMREVAAVASRVRSRFCSWIKLRDSSISQDSDFMNQQHGSFFLSRVVVVWTEMTFSSKAFVFLHCTVNQLTNPPKWGWLRPPKLSLSHTTSYSNLPSCNHMPCRPLLGCTSYNSLFSSFRRRRTKPNRYPENRLEYSAGFVCM